jgi:hypothetical protein
MKDVLVVTEKAMTSTTDPGPDPSPNVNDAVAEAGVLLGIPNQRQIKFMSQKLISFVIIHRWNQSHCNDDDGASNLNQATRCDFKTKSCKSNYQT